LERFQCCRLVRDVVERRCCGLNLGQRGLASLDAEAREPAQWAGSNPSGSAWRMATHTSRASLRSIRGSSAAALRIKVTLLVFRAAGSGRRRILHRHERMFACGSTRRVVTSATCRCASRTHRRRPSCPRRPGAARCSYRSPRGRARPDLRCREEPRATPRRRSRSGLKVRAQGSMRSPITIRAAHQVFSGWLEIPGRSGWPISRRAY